MANLCTQFEVSSLSHFRDRLGGLKIYNGSLDVSTPLSGTVCRPYSWDSGTCYGHHAHQILNLYVHHYDDMNSNAKCRNCVVLGVRVTEGRMQYHHSLKRIRLPIQL